MECKNLERGRVSFTSYIYQGACLSCAEFIIVYNLQVFLCLCAVSVLCGVSVDLFVNLVSVY